jgi:hypothetical protein
MKTSLVRKFCESRYRWPIVATATALLAVGTVAQMVDEYFDNRASRSELSEELARARDTAQALPQYEKRALEVGGKLAELERRTVTSAGLADFRSRLVDIVRDSGCQIRQIEVGEPTRRAWLRGDDPLKEPDQSATPGGGTPFSLERRSVLLAIDGTSAGGDTVMVEMELWLFALSRTAS